jgi:hypothetical protein
MQWLAIGYQPLRGVASCLLFKVRINQKYLQYLDPVTEFMNMYIIILHSTSNEINLHVTDQPYLTLENCTLFFLRDSSQKYPL